MSQFNKIRPIRKAVLMLAAVLVAAGLSGPAAQAVEATGTVTGTITEFGTSTPIEYIDVLLCDDQCDYQVDEQTNAAGEFTISGVPAGTYTLVANAYGDDERYDARYSDGTKVPSDGPEPTFTVAAGSSTTKNISLHRVTTLSGHVGATGIDDGGFSVDVVDLTTGDYVEDSNAYTDEGGAYTVFGLPAGTYRVEFNRSSGPALYAAQFYNGKAESAGAGAANLVTLAAEESKTGVDADLVLGGKITGRVVDASGAPAKHCSIHAYTADDHLVTRNDRTAVDGTFSVGGLATGDYRLVFNADADNPDDRCMMGPKRFFDDSSSTNLSQSESDGDTIAVTQGQTKALAEDLVVGDDVPSPSVTRFGGDDRFSTAAMTSSVFGPDVDAVFIANGFDFADGLAAGPGAAKNDSPVLIVQKDKVPDVVKAELTRLKPKKIYIVGGTGVISAAVASQMAAFTTGEVKRLSGVNRYATSADAATLWATADTVFLASGLGFADALSGGAAAARGGMPLLLTHPKTLQKATEDALTRLAPTKIVIAGGTGAVSAELENQVKSLVGNAVQVTRLDGTNRFDTAAKALKWYGGDSKPKLVLANGFGFPDALAGIPAAKKLNAGFALSMKTCIPSEVKNVLTVTVTKHFLLGGTGVLADGVETVVCNS